jgi:hypothetical protein
MGLVVTKDKIFSSEIGIDIDAIAAVSLVRKDPPRYDRMTSFVDVSLFKESMRMIDRKSTSTYVCLPNNRRYLILHLSDDTEVSLAFSNCKRYIGKITASDVLGNWYEIGDDNIFFHNLIK